jgi:hypothetical protein
MREDELQHFDNPLKGIMREGHKYLERLGEPGHYTYIYDTAKKAVDDAGKKANEAAKSATKITKEVMDAVEKTAVKLCTEGKKYTDQFANTPVSKTFAGAKDKLGQLIFKKKADTNSIPNKSKDTKDYLEHQQRDVLEVNDDGVNSFFQSRKGRTTNCAYCTLAWDLRQRGYDVQATQDNSGGLTQYDIEKIYVNKNGEHESFQTASFDQTARLKGRTGKMDESNFNEMRDNILAQGEGARGQLCGSYYMGGGHSMAYEAVDGKLMIIDGQSGHIFYGNDLSDFKKCSVAYMYETLILRTDDKEIDESYFSPYFSKNERKNIYNFVEDASKGTYHAPSGSTKDILSEHNRNVASSFLAKLTSRAIFGILLDNAYTREELHKGYNQLLKR